MKSFDSRLVSFATCFLAASSALAANNAGPGGGGGSNSGPGGGGSGGSGGYTEESIRRVPVEYLTIQAAIDAANQGDQIVVSPLGAYRGSGNSVIDTKGKALWIKALTDEFSGPVTIDGEDLRQGVHCGSGEGSNTIIEGFRIINCRPGASIYNSSPTFKNCSFKTNMDCGAKVRGESAPTFTNCTFQENRTPIQGGGLDILFSAATCVNCIFSENVATAGGALAVMGVGGTVSLTNCTFWNNQSELGGALMVSIATASLTDCTFDDNWALKRGGAIWSDFGSTNLTRCIFTGNRVDDGEGGGIFAHYRASFECHTTLFECQFESNSANLGGGVYVKLEPAIYSYSPKPVLTDTVVCGNSTDQINGDWIDNGGNSVSTLCGGAQKADVNSDGIVNGSDLAYVLGAWGSEDFSADIDEDGLVSGSDLALLLGAWN